MKYEHNNSPTNYFDGDKADAWDAVKIAYARRLSGSMMADDFPTPETDFDYRSVAGAAPLPGPSNALWKKSFPDSPNPHYKPHRAAFDELRRLFEEEWSR